jgi:polyvinyl alcohol dehydrogenase (cytochrome)
MSRSRPLPFRAAVILVGATLAALLGACSDDGEDDASTDQSAASTTASSAPSSSGAPSPLEPAAGTAVEPGGDANWSMHGHDLSGQRWNGFEDALGVEQAPALAVAWELDELQAVTGTPAVVDGTLYFADWTDTVRAVDPATGDEHWATPIDGQPTGSVAVTEDAVYVSGGRTTTRLDRETGEIEWSVEVNDHEFTRIYAGPVVVDGLVIQPVSGVQIAIPQDDYTFRGNIVALDEATGEEQWRVYVTEDDETSGAGVSVWAGASVDPERHLVFVGTGNTYEEPTSPLSDSIVAIDYTTGEVAWSTQFTSPDVYNMPGAGGADGPDADLGSTPTLWSVGDRDLVGAGDKAGMFHALDRETGELLWETELTPGSRLGGVIGGSAYADGRIFVASNVGDPATQVPTGVSKLFALDAGTGEVLWEADMELAVFGPATVANGVVYQGTGKPGMYAFDAESGEQLWLHEPPGQIGGGASVVDGTLYWGYGYWVIEAAEGQQGGLLAFRAE